METLEQIGDRFARLRKKQDISQVDAAKLLGCSFRTVGNFENGHTQVGGDIVLRALDLIEQWAPAKTREDAARPYVAQRKDTELQTPLSALTWALQSALAFVQDEDVPLRPRLLHVRKQLAFVMENFLSDASLPDEEEVEKR